jgi:hypothetical protein
MHVLLVNLECVQDDVEEQYADIDSVEELEDNHASGSIIC